MALSMGALCASESLSQSFQPIVLCPVDPEAPWDPMGNALKLCFLPPPTLLGYSLAQSLGCQQVTRTKVVIPQQAPG